MAVADSTIFIVLVMIVSLFSYCKISKFLGSLGIFLTGIGIMYAETTHAWTGLIIMAVGFLMIIYCIVEKPKKRIR